MNPTDAAHLHRPPPAIPAVNNEQDAIAYFMHPSYPPPNDVLFILPCVDKRNERGANESRPSVGLYHHVALLACQIVANNEFSGRLFFDREGTRAVVDEVSIQGLLLPGEYFFIVNSDPTYRYPVVPSFRDWRFPHGRMPDTWPSPPSADTVRRCAVTNHHFGLTNAHIVPREESEWFMHNGMSRYCVDMRDVNDSQNMILLRADIHRCFDARMFSIIPKPKFASDEPYALSPARDIAYVLHVFGPNIQEFSHMYHNTCLQYLNNIRREFLFARFAWTVLILLKPFLLAGTNRSVIRNNSQVAGMEWVTQELSGSELSSLYGGGGSRSASPKKRSRQGEDDAASLADADKWYQEVFEEDRGRKRFRRGSSPTLLDRGDSGRTPGLSSVSTLTSANKTPLIPPSYSN